MKKECLPDTPWHVGYAKKKEEDPRRHKARCVHIDYDGKCVCAKSGNYMSKCGGSSHCKYYAETWKQWEKVKEKTQTAEEKAEERIAQYKKTLIRKRENIRSNPEASIHYVTRENIIRCSVCGESVADRRVAKYCHYCDTYYVNKSQAVEFQNNNCVSDDKIIIVGNVRKKTK